MSESSSHLPSASPAAPTEGAEKEDGLVRVLFKGRRVESYLNPSGCVLLPGGFAVVEVERGWDLGEVLAFHPTGVRRRRDLSPKSILHPASEEEIAAWREQRGKDEEALRTVKDRVARFGLPMHLVDAEHQADGKRVTFYFTAEHRVDFRALVRDLAAIFHMRIELRQMGLRESARRLGGCGLCGRELCCCCVLCDFERVTLQMARDQCVALNPARLSGLCGRLLCCLSFEPGAVGSPPASRLPLDPEDAPFALES